MSARHSIQLGRTTASVSTGTGDIDVEISADLFALTSTDGTALGDMSVFSYTAPGEGRPLLVVFNGGPGSSSAWLHVSGIAAVTVPFDPELRSGAPVPTALVSSPDSVLDAVDLLFVDPIGTGYGRLAADADRAAVFGVHADARLFADVIRAWLRRAGRIGAPVHLLGESYGTIRAAAVAAELGGGFSPVPVVGMALLGQALNVQETAQRPGNVIGQVAGMSVLAAIGHFHGLVSAPDLMSAVDEARSFARTDYIHALMLGDAMTVDDRHAVAVRLEALTGLAAAEWERRGLWISKEDFRLELLRSQGRIVGRYDGRYLADSWVPRSGDLALDPSLTAVVPAFSAAMTMITVDLLGIEDDREYTVFDPTAAVGWEWDADAVGPGGPFIRYDYPRMLTRWMRENPRSRLLLGTGAHDTLTTVGAVDQLLSTTSLPSERVSVSVYPGGHMMYTDAAGARALSADLRRLVREDDR